MSAEISFAPNHFLHAQSSPLQAQPHQGHQQLRLFGYGTEAIRQTIREGVQGFFAFEIIQFPVQAEPLRGVAHIMIRNQGGCVGIELHFKAGWVHGLIGIKLGVFIVTQFSYSFVQDFLEKFQAYLGNESALLPS